MPSWVQTKRSNTAASAPAPADILEGQLAVNLADRQLYSKNAAGVIIPIGARVSVGATAPATPSTGDLWHDSTAGVRRMFVWDGAAWIDAAPATNTDEVVLIDPTPPAVQDIKQFITIQGRYPLIGFDSLVLNVGPTGNANPVDPIGDAVGSGDAFDTLESLFVWTSSHTYIKNLSINVSAGNYTSSGFTISRSIDTVVITGAGRAASVCTFTSPIDCYSGLLKLSSIKFATSAASVGWLLQPFGSFELDGGDVELYTPGNYALTTKGGLRLSGNAKLFIRAAGYGLAFTSGQLYVGAGSSIDINASHSTLPAIQLFSGIVPRATINLSGVGKKVNNYGAAIDWNLFNVTGGALYAYPNSLQAKITEKGGWVTDQVTGLCTQWNYGTVGHIIFPVAFKQKCYAISLGQYSSHTSYITAVSTTGFTLAGGYAYWTAIGY